jgi:hypothetical protein
MKSLFTALPEQLGEKPEAHMLPVEIPVIGRIASG